MDKKKETEKDFETFAVVKLKASRHCSHCREIPFLLRSTKEITFMDEHQKKRAAKLFFADRKIRSVMRTD